MTINIQNLVQALEQKQNSIISPLDIMQMSKAIDLLRLNKVNFIEKYSLLPDVNDVSLGTLYYVESEESLYIVESDLFVGKRWKSLSVIQGTVSSWGFNNVGQLGDGTTVNKSSPVSFIGGFNDWCQISSGVSHGIGIRTNGTLWSWGQNQFRQLGDNTSTNKSSPVSVVGGFTDWCQASAGYRHNSVVRTNGTIWSWGTNCFGELGDGTIVSKCSPVSVVGGFTDWCQVSAGGVNLAHTSAIRTNGTLWAWGSNTYGQLGDGTTVNKSSPISVVGGFTDWCKIESASQMTLALRTNGSLWAWGANFFGQLGDGTTVSKSSPVSVVGGFVDWCQVSAGVAHVSAVRTNGTLWTWGRNCFGELGDGTVLSKSSPVSVIGGFTDWCQVAVGVCHTTAVRTNGSLWAWGINNYGQLGDGTTVSKSSPVSIYAGNITWSTVFPGKFSSFTFASDLKDKKF